MRVLRNIVMILLIWVLFLTLVRYGTSGSISPESVELTITDDFDSWHAQKSFPKTFGSFFGWLETGPTFQHIREVIDGFTKRATSDIDVLNVLLTPIRLVWALIQDLFSFIAWLFTGF